jgi:hypothetical protein
MRKQYPLIRLPHEMETCLFLICEELKSRKIFQALHIIGLDDCYFQPHLDSLIIRFLDLKISDEMFTTYDDIMDKRARKIDESRESITKQALKAYNELVAIKKLKNPTEL